MSETTSKAFPTLDVLSAITGRLMTEAGIDAVYEVLNFMTGESLFTHQLPRVGREARQFMRARIPGFDEIQRQADDEVTHENFREVGARWIGRLGQTINVPKMGVDAHERIDPLSELAELVPPDRILTVKI